MGRGEVSGGGGARERRRANVDGALLPLWEDMVDDFVEPTSENRRGFPNDTRRHVHSSATEGGGPGERARTHRRSVPRCTARGSRARSSRTRRSSHRRGARPGSTRRCRPRAPRTRAGPPRTPPRSRPRRAETPPRRRGAWYDAGGRTGVRTSDARGGVGLSNLSASRFAPRLRLGVPAERAFGKGRVVVVRDRNEANAFDRPRTVAST